MKIIIEEYPFVTIWNGFSGIDEKGMIGENGYIGQKLEIFIHLKSIGIQNNFLQRLNQ